MKKVFIIISLAVLSSCSVKTNEEKARELIDPDIKSHLIKPESYEIAEIYLDSCFSDDIKYNPDIITCSIKLATSYNEYKKHMVDAEMAESSMNLYTSSYGRMEAYTEQHRKKYKAEMEKARRKADTAKQKILQLYRSSVELAEKVNDDKHEFSGWIAFIAYRAETAVVQGQKCQKAMR